jgi:hypothetical protein
VGLSGLEQKHKYQRGVCKLGLERGKELVVVVGG